MKSTRELGDRLYAAFASGDVATLTDLMAENFRGTLTAGLPNGFGRTYEGRDAMMNEGWGSIGRDFQMAPQLDDMTTTDDLIIGRGYYVGQAVATQKPVRARFAHFWTVKDGKITGVEQVTDSAAWHAALA